MNNINGTDDLSLKQIILYLGGKSLELKITGPENNNELNELKELDKQGLVKFQVIDASSGFVARKDILQKLINDLSTQNAFTEIVDRNIKSPSLVQICASNVWLRKSKLTPEEFEKMVCEEDLMLEKYRDLKK